MVKKLNILHRPCEGGHVGYSPSNELEIEYL